jgi:hypothetical protein
VPVTTGSPWKATRLVKAAEPEQKKPAGIGVFAKSMKVEPSPFVIQTSIPFWMTRSAANAEVAKQETRKRSREHVLA